jgi:Holliday junction resolvasome RuvABC endonuclease subunit
MSGRLMFLDLAGNVGWSLFRPTSIPSVPPLFGEHRWRGMGFAVICGRLGNWLDDFYSVEPWDAMAWEEPWLRPGDKPATIKILFGLVGVASAFATSARHPMPWCEIPPKAIKKRMTGRQDADKRDVIAACWSLGWKVGSPDAADACGGGLIAYRQIWPKS